VLGPALLILTRSVRATPVILFSFCICQEKLSAPSRERFSLRCCYSEIMKTRRITAADVKRRLFDSVCPACGDHTIAKRVVTYQRDDGTWHFGGACVACLGPRGWECYYLSDAPGQERETTTAPPLKPFPIGRPTGVAGVIRRTRSCSCE
jgi:hypothetical protein